MGETIRAVVYCRVSTSSDAQMESLDKQVLEAVETAAGLGYELVDRFIDEGKTGTTKDARKEYLRMLSGIEQNEFDVIVTKSLDRMNRNILDFYLFLDLIIRNDVKLYFYLDRVFYKADDKIVIGIKAILAEEYSRELSKKLCNAHARRQERGEVVMLGSRTYGYRKIGQPDGKKQVVAEEEEAGMIRLIFDYCREGHGARAISGFLYSGGYRNRNGNQISESTIRRMIRNPLVTGTMVMNRVRFDFNTKKTIHTEPSQWIWKDNAVPVIIPLEEWREANERMDSRVNKKSANKIRSAASGGGQGLYKGKFDFSGKIRCGLCGKPYYRAGRMKKGEPVEQWRCSTYIRCGRIHGFRSGSIPCPNPKEKEGIPEKERMPEKKGGCNGLSLDEEQLIKILAALSGERWGRNWNKGALIDETMEILDNVIGDDRETEKYRILCRTGQLVSARQASLLEKYLDEKVSDESYSQMDRRLREEADRVKRGLELLNTPKEHSNCNRAAEHEGGQRMKDIEDFLRDGGFEQTLAYLLSDTIKCIVVYQERLDIEFEEGAVTTVLLGEFGALGQPDKVRLSEEKICSLILENPKITMEEMAGALGLGKRTVCSRVAGMKKKGRIGVRGRGPGTAWYVVPD